MIRAYIAVLQILGVLFINLLLGGDVSVTMNVPGQINAGKDLKVEITLKKGDLAGFSRFQMDLPPGITATNIYSANADFSFKDQKLRLIWLRLPEDESFTFSFNLQCDERLKGSFEVAGKFSFIDNNERKTVDLQPKLMAIVPSSSIDPGLLVDIKDYGKSALPQLGVNAAGDYACIRQKPAWSENNNEYIVTLLVNKESLKKFAKIEEVVPSGYTALAVECKEGVFTFKDNKAKFLWMNLPADPFFTVSYKLIPMKTTPAKQPVIKGVFSYITDDKTQSLNVIEKDVNLAKLSPEMVKDLLNQKASPSLLAVNQSGTNSSNETEAIDHKNSAKQTIYSSSTSLSEQKNKAESKIPEKNQTKVNGTTTDKASINQPEVADLLESQSGLYFRVQIAAGHKPINTKSYFHKFQLDTMVMKEKHEGWIKYSVGSFHEYKIARDYRVHLWNTTSINDAFVAAYNDGKRITVQEALMVGNQKWYQ